MSRVTLAELLIVLPKVAEPLAEGRVLPCHLLGSLQFPTKPVPQVPPLTIDWTTRSR